MVENNPARGGLELYIEAKSNLFVGREEEVKQALSTIQMVGDRLAHFEYGSIREIMGDEAFFDLLARMGMNRERFDIINDTSCVSGVCFVHPRSFCDPDFCGH